MFISNEMDKHNKPNMISHVYKISDTSKQNSRRGVNENRAENTEYTSFCEKMIYNEIRCGAYEPYKSEIELWFYGFCESDVNKCKHECEKCVYTFGLLCMLRV